MPQIKKKNTRQKNTKKKSNAKKNTRKSKASEKKGIKGKISFNPEYHNLILIFIGIFLMYSLYSGSKGLVPEFMQQFFKGLFGALAIIAPILFVVFGVLGFTNGNEQIDRIKKTKLLYIMILFLMIIYGLLNFVTMPTESPLSNHMRSDIISRAISLNGCGLVPTIITYYMIKVLGVFGSWLMLLLGIIITVMYVFKISITDILNAAKGNEEKTNLLSKFKGFVDDKTINIVTNSEEKQPKKSIFSKFKEKLPIKNKISEENEDDCYETVKLEKNGMNLEDSEMDPEDRTIKIVGFNKAEDDYLEILEGTQSVDTSDYQESMDNDDFEILNKLKNSGKTELKKDPKIEDFDKNTVSAINPDGKDNVNNFAISNVEIASAHSDKTINNGGLNLGKEEENTVENDHLKYINYELPDVKLLNSVKKKTDSKSKQKVIKNAEALKQTLKDFGVDANINQVTVGPTITRYEIQPKPGVKVSKIVNLTDDIALSLAARSIRIEAPIPGKNAIGIEVPNEEAQMVGVKEIIDSDEFRDHKSSIAMGLGKDVSGKIIVGDIASMPHMLIAGSTGSGKSVCVNTLISSILYKSKPDEVKLLLIDPKVVELANYNGIPHLLIPVVTDPKKAANALNWAVTEMNRRYKLFADNQVKDITSYNEKTDKEQKLPKIVIIIDELADLMMVSANDIEDCICRLAQMARAAGMHLIIATQRPSVDVITGIIKANIPSRIAFAVSSQIDSRTILDSAGAEKLLGKGDMLYYPIGASKPQRLQGAFISEEESESVIEFVKNQVPDLTYEEDIIDKISNVSALEENDEDEHLQEAINLVVSTGQASASMLQRKFKVGFNRASNLIDMMESRGIVGPREGSKARKVLISEEDYQKLLEP